MSSGVASRAEHAKNLMISTLTSVESSISTRSLKASTQWSLKASTQWWTLEANMNTIKPNMVEKTLGDKLEFRRRLHTDCVLAARLVSNRVCAVASWPKTVFCYMLVARWFHLAPFGSLLAPVDSLLLVPLAAILLTLRIQIITFEISQGHV